MRLRVAKIKNYNVAAKQMGFSARVITNGTAGYDEIAEDAAENTTFNVDEIRAAAGIFCRAASKLLRQGFIVDLGPIGKIYPSCTSGWFDKAEDLTMESVKPSLYFHPAEGVAAAIKGATLVWAKPGEDEGEDGNATDGGNSDSGGNGGDDGME